MTVNYTLGKVFQTYTALLNYIEESEKIYKESGIQYKMDVFYRIHLDDYRLIIYV